VKSLGELLGHRVTVRSAIGRGSVFAIELERAAAMAVPEDARSTPPFVRGVNVALVDDDAEIRESMRLLFESWGCVCFGGATAAAVEEELRARSAAPDALIVDYRLADAMTGLQVIERLRARFGEHLPALVITGTPNAALIRHQLAGIPFATKPVAPGKLRAFLSQVAREA
jgi:DNA-binding response OmpR family regulator